MNYGVTITSGAKPWQIFQKNKNNETVITLCGQYTTIRQSQELPLCFEDVHAQGVTVKARIASENTGESILPWTSCTLLPNSEWTIRFTVPAGGLYRVETHMEYEGWGGLSSTRGDMVHNIGVGDIYVIAGQSNASGRSKSPIEDAPQLGIHVLHPSAEWQLATHPLAETTNAVHIGNFENHNPGHTPWLAFAKRLARELGYPIGLVPCAYGGSPLRWWNPAENGSLFNNMLAMLADYAIKPAGVLWVQGEAEGYETSAETYLERFTEFVNAVRGQLGESLPFITVQINRCVSTATPEFDHQWGMVRQAQRQAAKTIKSLAVVPSNDLALYDSIHNSSEGNLVIAERCARAALGMIYGKSIDYLAPEPLSAVQTAPDTVVLTLSNIRNWINPFDVAPALLPINAEDDNGIIACKEYVAGQNTLTLTFERALTGHTRLHGAWRTNTGGLIPCDCMRMPMLSFYNFTVDKE